MEEIKEKATEEAEVVAQYLFKLDDMRRRKTQLMVENPNTKARTSVNAEYILGKSTLRQRVTF